MTRPAVRKATGARAVALRSVAAVLGCLALVACGVPLRPYAGYDTALTAEQVADRDRVQATMPTRPVRLQYRAPATCRYETEAIPSDPTIGPQRTTHTVSLTAVGDRILVVRRIPERVLATTLIDRQGRVQDFNLGSSGQRLTPETMQMVAEARRQAGDRSTPYNHTSMWFPTLRAPALRYREVVGTVATADPNFIIEAVFAGVGTHQGRQVILLDFLERRGGRSALIAYSLMDPVTAVPVVFVQYIPNLAFVRYRQIGCTGR